MNTDERPLVGWREIAAATPYSWETLRRGSFKADMIKAGVVFFAKIGRPPRLRPHAYPSKLADFFSNT